MADIYGSPGPDSVTVESGNTYRAGAGNDIITLNGWSTGQGQEGNDTFIAGTGTSGFGPTVWYWGAQSTVYVDLAAGYALDGLGGRDTLINIHQVHGFSRPGDMGYGTEQADLFWLGSWNSGSGKIVIDGRGGSDQVVINAADLTKTGGGQLVLNVSADGRTAWAHGSNWPNLVYELHNIEVFELSYWPADSVNYELASLIDLSQVGQAILLRAAKGWQTGAVGSPVTLSYSFLQQAPASGAEGGTGFTAFASAQQAVVRDSLAQLQQQTGLQFVEVSGDAGQLRFGINQQVATRAYSFLPDHFPLDAKAGDVWLDVETAAVLQPGQEGFYVLLHEIAHALGLQHPLPESDTSGQTVLLNRFANFGNTLMIDVPASAVSAWPSWYGAFDLNALRSLYGTTAYASANNSYFITPQQAQSFVVLLDDGGTDTLDLSGTSSSAYVDLQPSHSSNVGIDANGKTLFNNLSIPTGSWIENLVLTRFDDAATGNSLDNRITSVGGNDAIDGLAGRDVVVLPGQLADWDVERSDVAGIWYASNRVSMADSDRLTQVERLSFSDLQLALDTGTGEHANQVARILGAVFGSSAVNNAEYAGIGLYYLDSAGYSYEALIQLALQVRLGGSANDPVALVNLLYTNLVQQAPTSAQAQPFVEMVTSHSTSSAGLAMFAADTDLNALNIDLIGIMQQGLIYQAIG